MPNKPSTLTRAITSDGSASILFADTASVVQRARELHHTSKTMTAALGRCLTAASLMGSLLKSDGASLTLRFRGDGPAGTITCVSDSSGNVRGCADHPEAELPPNAQGKLDVGGAIGAGTLYVVRDLGMGKEPYVGQCPIKTGEVAEDITEYYARSEQTPTVCALGVRVDRELNVISAGGFLVQLLPFADEEIIPRLEENIGRMPSVSALLAEGLGAGEIIGRVFDGLPFELWESTETAYRCTCSRERYAAALAGLQAKDLQSLIESGEPIETRCHFCSAVYTFTPDELRRLAQERRA